VKSSRSTGVFARVLLLSSIPVSLLAGPVTTTIDSGGIFCTPQAGNSSKGFVGGDGSTTAMASAFNVNPFFGNYIHGFSLVVR